MTDILDQIDAAVAQDCACGCGQRLNPNGPSGWFAFPECAWEWHNQNVTDPYDVYRRTDADDCSVPIRFPSAEEWARLGRRVTGGGYHVDAGRVYAARLVLTFDPERARAVVQESMEYLRAALEPPMRRLAEDLNEWVRSWPAATAATGIAAPEDPRERALAHVRNRNTGPKPRQRAPKRLDPRR